METTRINPVSSPMHRDELARQGGGRLFYLRRERDFARGLLSARGHGNDYLVFQPSKYFTRILGDRLLRLNEALCDVRGQGAELIPSVGVARLQAHYLELDRLIEAARDKLAGLIEYCHKGYTGRFREALEAIEPDAASGALDTADRSGLPETAGVQPSDSSDTYVAAATAGAVRTDVFDALRQRHFDQGIVTEFGRDQGCVAFQPSPFFGRFLGEIAYSLNDALRRLEGNTSYYVMSGDGDTLQNYYLGLESGLAEIGRGLDGIIACCKRKVA